MTKTTMQGTIVKRGLRANVSLLLALAFTLPFTSQSWAEQCDRDLPSCVNVITLTEEKISMRNDCDFNVAVRVWVENGLGGGYAKLKANGRPFTYDEDDLIPNSPPLKATYRRELKCCTHFDDSACALDECEPGLSC